MNLLTTEEKIQCLKNLLADPEDWISSELLRLSAEEETQQGSGPAGKNEWSPEAVTSSSKAK